jgi:phosphatidylglycerol:prolipoprotein diacylglycerol transferase
MIFSITLGLFIYSKNKKFDGQIFLLYIISYSVGRFVIEYFRGDESRGYVIGDVISNSQFIGMIFIGVAIYYYQKLNSKPKLYKR